LIGLSEIAVKTAFLDWEAAVLPLNYAREIKVLAGNWSLIVVPS
jgi:hypothetical protein